jgi:hypothetical protein
MMLILILRFAWKFYVNRDQTSSRHDIAENIAHLALSEQPLAHYFKLELSILVFPPLINKVSKNVSRENFTSIGISEAANKIWRKTSYTKNDVLATFIISGANKSITFLTSVTKITFLETLLISGGNTRIDNSSLK